MSQNKTIAAISTPAGPGGIAIIRISGPGAETVMKSLFRPHRQITEIKSHLMHLGRIVDPDRSETIDEVLCCFMKAPRTYTREDVVEIQCHGGPVVAARILEAVLRTGVEPAAPGEFTKRAFLAGRIDLSQAEAVAELIGARCEAEARLASVQLGGAIGQKVGDIQKALVGLLAQVESSIDFPEEDLQISTREEVLAVLRDNAFGPLSGLIEAYEDSKAFREGLKVAIVGRPNVGKSSLLNRLVKAEKAIVTELPGTTRDLIEVDAIIGGIPLTVVDTAGLESPPADPVEAEGQRRAAAKLAQADLALAVLDRSRPISDEDLRILNSCPLGRTIAVLNKSDVDPAFGPDEIDRIIAGGIVQPISALTAQGLDELARTIFQLATGRTMDARSIPGVAPNLRQKIALENAGETLERVRVGVENDLAPELLALELNEALDELGKITGRTTPDDVLDEIFSRFCLGK